MKISSLFLVISFILLTGLVKPVKAQESGNVASSIEWTATTFDFGKIDQGQPVTAEFEFRNTSMVPLIINSVQPSCGCTVADYPKEPIQPGKSGKIAVTFNAASKGAFQKSVLISTNATEGRASLIIKGEVASL
ncbi:MAG: DUF1573 domain-containing protein [Bacteroidales bacterium]|nr:DUF1573 domain-containing protein [Bacteroidales bacterium]